MRLTVVLLTLAVASVRVRGNHLVIGNVADRVVLAKHELVEYNAVPFTKRVKYYFYSGPEYKKIQGIQALDTLHSKASVNITAGGVGHSFVNLRMKSERGWGLAYDIGIYVSPDFFSFYLMVHTYGQIKSKSVAKLDNVGYITESLNQFDYSTASDGSHLNHRQDDKRRDSGNFKYSGEHQTTEMIALLDTKTKLHDSYDENRMSSTAEPHEYMFQNMWKKLYHRNKEKTTKKRKTNKKRKGKFEAAKDKDRNVDEKYINKNKDFKLKTKRESLGATVKPINLYPFTQTQNGLEDFVKEKKMMDKNKDIRLSTKREMLSVPEEPVNLYPFTKTLTRLEDLLKEKKYAEKTKNFKPKTKRESLSATVKPIILYPVAQTLISLEGLGKEKIYTDDNKDLSLNTKRETLGVTEKPSNLYPFTQTLTSLESLLKVKKTIEIKKDFRPNMKRDMFGVTEKPNLYTYTETLSSLEELVNEIENLEPAQQKKETNKKDSTYIPYASNYIHTDDTGATATSEEETVSFEILMKDRHQKEMLMISEQTPAMTAMIDNTVTELTYRADPILMSKGDDYTSNPRTGFFIKEANISGIAEDSENKIVGNKNVSKRSTENKHDEKSNDLHNHSIKDDARTLASDIDVHVQKELHCLYDYIKQRLASTTTKDSTTHKIKNKKTTTNSHNVEADKSENPSTVVDVESALNRQYRSAESQAEDEIFGFEDDYEMLNVLQDQLTKQQDTSTPSSTPRYLRERYLQQQKMRKPTCKLSKRNLETIEDLKLREAVHGKNAIFDNILYYDVDYKEGGLTSMLPIQNLEEVTEPIDVDHYKDADKDGHVDNSIDDDTDTFGAKNELKQELKDKISYRKYVDGYREYLNFTKDLAKDKFSDRVRFQAHMHHKVDDIGKYILDKIPRICTARSKRRILEDFETDDEESSTKSDESWLKKHFYIYLDSGPPRKHHSAQTVLLKANSAKGTSFRSPSIKAEKKSKSAKDIENAIKKSYDVDNLKHDGVLKGGLADLEVMMDLLDRTNIHGTTEKEAQYKTGKEKGMDKGIKKENSRAHLKKSITVNDKKKHARIRRDTGNWDMVTSVTSDDVPKLLTTAAKQKKFDVANRSSIPKQIDTKKEPLKLNHTEKRNILTNFFSKINFLKKKPSSVSAKRIVQRDVNETDLRDEICLSVKPVHKDQKHLSDTQDLVDKEDVNDETDLFKSLSHDIDLIKDLSHEIDLRDQNSFIDGKYQTDLRKDLSDETDLRDQRYRKDQKDLSNENFLKSFRNIFKPSSEGTDKKHGIHATSPTAKKGLILNEEHDDDNGDPNNDLTTNEIQEVLRLHPAVQTTTTCSNNYNKYGKLTLEEAEEEIQRVLELRPGRPTTTVRTLTEVVEQRFQEHLGTSPVEEMKASRPFHVQHHKTDPPKNKLKVNSKVKDKQNSHKVKNKYKLNEHEKSDHDNDYFEKQRGYSNKGIVGIDYMEDKFIKEFEENLETNTDIYSEDKTGFDKAGERKYDNVNDYFNDLLIFDEDILTMDTVTEANVLSETRTTTIDMNSVRQEISDLGNDINNYQHRQRFRENSVEAKSLVSGFEVPVTGTLTLKETTGEELTTLLEFSERLVSDDPTTVERLVSDDPTTVKRLASDDPIIVERLASDDPTITERLVSDDSTMDERAASEDPTTAKKLASDDPIQRPLSDDPTEMVEKLANDDAAQELRSDAMMSTYATINDVDLEKSAHVSESRITTREMSLDLADELWNAKSESEKPNTPESRTKNHIKALSTVTPTTRKKNTRTYARDGSAEEIDHNLFEHFEQLSNTGKPFTRATKKMRVTQERAHTTRSVTKQMKQTNSKMTSAKLKSNPLPTQTFSTPEPMTSKDFVKFLKDNDLDIMSLTTPLPDLSSFETVIHEKMEKYSSKFPWIAKKLENSYTDDHAKMFSHGKTKAERKKLTELGNKKTPDTDEKTKKKSAKKFFEISFTKSKNAKHGIIKPEPYPKVMSQKFFNGNLNQLQDNLLSTKTNERWWKKRLKFLKSRTNAEVGSYTDANLEGTLINIATSQSLLTGDYEESENLRKRLYGIKEIEHLRSQVALSSNAEYLATTPDIKAVAKTLMSEDITPDIKSVAKTLMSEDIMLDPIKAPDEVTTPDPLAVAQKSEPHLVFTDNPVTARDENLPNMNRYEDSSQVTETTKRRKTTKNKPITKTAKHEKVSNAKNKNAEMIGALRFSTENNTIQENNKNTVRGIDKNNHRHLHNNLLFVKSNTLHDADLRLLETTPITEVLTLAENKRPELKKTTKRLRTSSQADNNDVKTQSTPSSLNEEYKFQPLYPTLGEGAHPAMKKRTANSRLARRAQMKSGRTWSKSKTESTTRRTTEKYLESNATAKLAIVKGQPWSLLWHIVNKMKKISGNDDKLHKYILQAQTSATQPDVKELILTTIKSYTTNEQKQEQDEEWSTQNQLEEVKTREEELQEREEKLERTGEELLRVVKNEQSRKPSESKSKSKTKSKSKHKPKKKTKSKLPAEFQPFPKPFEHQPSLPKPPEFQPFLPKPSEYQPSLPKPPELQPSPPKPSEHQASLSKPREHQASLSKPCEPHGSLPKDPPEPEARTLPCVSDIIKNTQHFTNNTKKTVEGENYHATKETSTYNFDDETLKSLITKQTKKRSASPNLYYTAKDVSALEIVVDLIENSAQNNAPSRIIALPSPKNNIQVLIEIPYAALSGRKRSQNQETKSGDVKKIRKVFSVKMITPVDLKYQIQSFEVTEPTTVAQANFSTGIYFLVDNTNSIVPGKKRAFTPIQDIQAFTTPMTKSNVNEVISSTRLPNKRTAIEATSPKNAGRKTMNKVLMAAVNKHLDRLETLVSQHNDKRETTHSPANKDNKCEKCDNRTLVDRIFGRPFKCTCRANHTMCINCAACDAVMTEIFMGFDNLNSYMSDHCNEIQSYFYVNPTGGRKLIEMVHKIDKNLNDYLKRNKGKCKCKCQTFSCCGYADKELLFLKPNDDQTQFSLLINIASLANDLHNAAKLKLCAQRCLKNTSQDFVRTAQKCILNETSSKNITKKDIKRSLSVYPVDDNNVHIISSDDSTTESISKYITLPTHYEPKLGLFYVDKYYPTKETSNHEEDEVKKPINKRFKYFFKKKKNKCKQNIGHNKRVVDKRQVAEQSVAHLNLDAGGSFWENYWTRITPLEKQMIENMTPAIKMKVVQNHKPIVIEEPLGKVTSKSKDTFRDFFKRYTQSLAAIETTTRNIKKTTDSAKEKSSNSLNCKRSKVFNSVKIENSNGSSDTVTEFSFKFNVYHRPSQNLTKKLLLRPLITKTNFLPNESEPVGTESADTIPIEKESAKTSDSVSQTSKTKPANNPNMKSDTEIKDEPEIKINPEVIDGLKIQGDPESEFDPEINDVPVVKNYTNIKKLLETTDLQNIMKSKEYVKLKKIEIMLDGIIRKLKNNGRQHPKTIKPNYEHANSEMETARPDKDNSAKTKTTNENNSRLPNFSKIWIPSSDPTNNSIDYTSLRPNSRDKQTKNKLINNFVTNKTTNYPSTSETITSKASKQSNIKTDFGDVSDKMDMFKPTILPLKEKLKSILKETTQLSEIVDASTKMINTENIFELQKNKTTKGVVGRLKSATKDFMNIFKNRKTEKTSGVEYGPTMKLPNGKENMESLKKNIRQIKNDLNKLQRLRNSKKARKSVNVLSKRTTKLCPSVIIFDNWEENDIANPTNVKQEHKSVNNENEVGNFLQITADQLGNDTLTVKDTELKTLHENVLDYKKKKLEDEIYNPIPNDDFIIILDQEDDNNGQTKKVQKTGSHDTRNRAQKPKDYASGDYDLIEDARGMLDSLRMKFRKLEDTERVRPKDHEVTERTTVAEVSGKRRTEFSTTSTASRTKTVKAGLISPTQSLLQKLRKVDKPKHYESLFDHIDVKVLLPDHDNPKNTTDKSKWVFLESADLEYPELVKYYTEKENFVTGNVAAQKATEKITTQRPSPKTISTTTKRETLTIKPVTTAAKLVTITTKPVPITTKPVPTTAKLKTSTTKPETTTTKRETTTAKPESTTTTQETTTKKSETLSTKSESLTTKLETPTTKLETTTTKPEARTAKPKTKLTTNTITTRPYIKQMKLSKTEKTVKIKPTWTSKQNARHKPKSKTPIPHSKSISSSRTSTQFIKKFYRERPKPIDSFIWNRKLEAEQWKTTEATNEQKIYEAATTVEAAKQTLDSSNTIFTRIQKKSSIGEGNYVEACDPKTEECLCDVLATYQHVLESRSSMSQRDFERFVRDVTCHVYKKPPKQFLVEPRKRKSWRRKGTTFDAKRQYEMTKTNDMHNLRWNWIRKRSVLSFNDKLLDSINNDYGYFTESNRNGAIENPFSGETVTDDFSGYEEIEDMKKNNVNTEMEIQLESNNNRKTVSNTDNKESKNIEELLKTEVHTFGTLDDYSDVQMESNRIATRFYELEDKISDTNLKDQAISRDNIECDTNKNAYKEIHTRTSFKAIHKDKNLDGDDGFEEMFKGEHGVYSNERKRRKRSAADLRELVNGLKNLPPLEPAVNEILAMPGDTVQLTCNPHIGLRELAEPISDWSTGREAMLKYDNVILDRGVVIKGVQSRNGGNYTCSQELKALQHLGPLMAEAGSCGRDQDALRIHEPMCLQDKDGGSDQVRATAVLSCPAVSVEVQCSAQCRRDLQGSMALICATNAVLLANIEVVVSKNGVNKSLTPCLKNYRRSIVTHTLRRKEVSSPSFVHQLSARMAPGDVEISLVCPAGHYLIAEQKICAACPADTWSAAGDNSCRACAPHTRAEPGANGCRLLLPLRNCDWWWYPPCGYVIAFIAVLCVCSACARCACAARVTSPCRDRDRDRDRGPVTVTAAAPARTESRWTWGRFRAATRSSSTAAAVTGRRPLSPSRVILAKFFRLSPRSSRISDDRESRFEQWKEKNRPPSLPSIDFDA